MTTANKDAIISSFGPLRSLRLLNHFDEDPEQNRSAHEPEERE